MNVKLVARHNGRRTVIPLRSAVAVVGRAHGNAVRIPSAEVSRRHCRLVYKDGFVTAEDMDSVNGTFLNGKLLKTTQPVYPGDKLDIGPVSFTVEYELSAKAKAKMGGGSAAQEEPSELLQALADGELTFGDGFEQLPELEAIEPSPPRSSGSGELEEEIEFARPSGEGLQPIVSEFDFEATPWQMPSGGDLRDLMEEEPTKQHKAKKRRSDD